MEDFDGIKINDIDELVKLKTIDDFISNDLLTQKTKKTCLVCLGVNNSWESYILPCGHTAHTRCFRKFITLSNKCICPVCKKMDFGDQCIVCLKKSDDYICSKTCLDDFKNLECV